MEEPRDTQGIIRKLLNTKHLVVKPGTSLTYSTKKRINKRRMTARRAELALEEQFYDAGNKQNWMNTPHRLDAS